METNEPGIKINTSTDLGIEEEPLPSPAMNFEVQGRMGGPLAAGPGGDCVCPNCGHVVSHETGDPCDTITCPHCETAMVRRPSTEEED